MGRVFVSYSHEDAAWLERLQVHLKPLEREGLVELWADTRIATGSDWRRKIEQAMSTAQVAVLLVSADFLASDFIAANELPPLLQRAELDGLVIMPLILSPCLFEQTTSISRFQAVNPVLPPHSGMSRVKRERMFQKLSLDIADTLKRGAAARASASADTDRDDVIDLSQRIVSELRDAAVQFRSIGDLLAVHSAPGTDLRSVLEEVGKTYRVVSSAIEEFLAPAIGTASIDATPYYRMERGTLRTRIENGRGHCHQIEHIYRRAGGLRDVIATTIPAVLGQADTVFGRLSVGDMDLFIPLVRIGDVLTSESRVVADLLISEQELAARQRIRDGRRKLAPLEAQLSDAMTELQQIEASLGYVGSW